jgi:hypothetical protein
MMKLYLCLNWGFTQFPTHVKLCLKVSPWWNSFLLSPKGFMQKVKFCWCGVVFNVHETLMKSPLRPALVCFNGWDHEFNACISFQAKTIKHWVLSILAGAFYGGLYHLISLLKKDKYGRIRRLRLIVYTTTTSIRVVYIGGMVVWGCCW